MFQMTNTSSVFVMILQMMTVLHLPMSLYLSTKTVFVLMFRLFKLHHLIVLLKILPKYHEL